MHGGKLSEPHSIYFRLRTLETKVIDSFCQNIGLISQQQLRVPGKIRSFFVPEFDLSLRD